MKALLRKLKRKLTILIERLFRRRTVWASAQAMAPHGDWVLPLPNLLINTAHVAWIGQGSNGTVRVRLIRAVHDDEEIPGIAFDGRDVIVLAGEGARVLWQHGLRLAGGADE